ncbi:MAG: hypothetical protein HY959_03790 [Ignavibacteriae bacterium]|nr:hypothetical protein [Ignavibacteriota bacterium]
MIIETQKTVKVKELEHLISKSGGGTWRALYDVLYYTRLLKYVHKSQYKTIKSHYFKITADWKLKDLCEKGYLYSPSQDVYCASNKVLPILEAVGYNMTLPSEPRGKGDINEISNTSAFIQLIKEPYFYTLLYPNFGYLIPDALLVEKNERKYRLTFIEVERPKPDWEYWIENKKNNYFKLSKDYQVYDYWLIVCEKLGFPKPQIVDFKFNYKIIK